MLKKRRIIAMVLVTILSVCAFSGCKKSSDDGSEWYSYEYIENSENSGSSKGNEVKSSNSSINNDSNIKNQTGTNGIVGANTNIKNPLSANLSGATIIIYDTSSVFSPDSTKSKQQAAQAEILSKLEKELNCKIKETSLGEEMYQQVMLNAASGTYYADMICSRIYTSVGYISSGFCYDLSKLPTVDLSKSYMNVADGVNAYHLGSGYYATAEPMTNSSFGNHLLFNKRILEEIGYSKDYIYDLMKQGKWNISEFRQIAKKAVKDLDGVSGMTTKDRCGIIQIDIGSSGFSNVLETMGADMIKNTNGVLSYNMNDPSVSNAMSMAYDIYIKDGICLPASDKDAKDLFMSGHGLFLGGSYLSQLSYISDMEDEFGLVPFPSNNGSSNYRMPANWNFMTLMLPSNLNDKKAKNAGAFLQAYMYLSQNVMNTSYNEYSSRYLCDEQSKSNLYTCYNSVRITPSSVIGNQSLTEIFNGTYRVLQRVAGGENAVTMIQSTMNSAKTALSEINTKFK